MTDAAPDPLAETWSPLPSADDRVAAGRAVRGRVPRRELARIADGERDPLGILDRQNASRVPELVPLRRERMSQSPFAFFRGSAAVMAADLGRDPSSGLHVASCGDAHVSNFGFYASPQRTLVFDLNDFDEAAWAPWEWDVKRLLTSVVIAGQATARDPRVVQDAVLTATRAYARSLAAAVRQSPTDRYFAHFDVQATLAGLDKESRTAIAAVIRDAEKRTGERATRRLTALEASGRRVFLENPPTMAHATADVEARIQTLLAAYTATVGVDIRMVLENYVPADVARRVVGVGSVGTRCYLTILQDGDGNGLLLQAKESGRSVLSEYGGIPQPSALRRHIEQFGEGGRVVALQRILQASSDPFLGHLQNEGLDFYVRQFHDKKGSVEVETLDDTPFITYAQSCAITLARAHAQSPNAAAVAGYIGSGRSVGTALLQWSTAYAEVSRADYDAYVAAG